MMDDGDIMRFSYDLLRTHRSDTLVTSKLFWLVTAWKEIYVFSHRKVSWWVGGIAIMELVPGPDLKFEMKLV